MVIAHVASNRRPKVKEKRRAAQIVIVRWIATGVKTGGTKATRTIDC